ncbi:MAG: subtilase, partial [Cyanobacteria bacterium SW_9_44_58]
MIELMYDVTPSADFAFHTAFEGPADFASGITDLVNAGADVIVDDVFYKSQPFFQDSVIAQAADQAADAGVPYFSSAGNANRQSHETDFRDSGQTFDLFGGDDKDDSLAHDFDPGSGTDILQEFSLANNESIGLSFQWDQPHAQAGGTGSANDMDIFVVNDNGQIVTGSADTNVNGDPVEFLNFTNTTGSAANFNLLITQYLPAGGPTPGKIKYIDFSGGTSDAEFFTNSSTSFGHPNAAGAAGVGAAFYGDTPECGTNPPQVEDFSSAGGTEILFDTDGNRLNSPEVRDQPRFTAPDGTNTTFFGSDIAQDSDSSPNFFGTSAAAPHAAAVAALMQEAAGGPNSLTPEEIYTALENTAIDMGDSGFDFNTGNGLIQAPEAIEAVADQGNESPTAVNNTASTEEDTATTINVLSNDDFGGDGPASNSLVIASAASNGNAAVDNSGTPNDPTDDRI